ncbi:MULTISPECIES: DUF3987 domain-containing protein [unclassified Streptomyces]|uniref:DUF3987 domain-containing protein n=1 Tax=unclassified Streptomyces TaxID=2593676 RepID=UPI00081F6E5E|nr:MULTISPECIES: DUF3987 domain-containing protein [unclassified Streptomyces]MYR95477.1 hypothetical protein [Streptomyces sp. SID4937]SCD91057.1 hypothetical protein GA0115243_104762 [Streptomyces sp. ScaeMP-e83]
MKVLENRLDRFESMAYGPIGKAVRQAMPHTEGDPIGVLASTYAMLSSAFAGQVLLPGGTRPALAWTVLVGRSSTGGKGRAYRAASRIVDGAIGSYLGARTKTSIKNAPTLVRVFTQAIQESKSTEAGEDSRVFMLCTEWGSTLKFLNRDAQFSEHLRNAWDGSPISNTIKGKKAAEAEEEWIDHPLLGFHGHIQPGIWPSSIRQVNALGGDYNRMLPVAVEEWQELDELSGLNTDPDSLIKSSSELETAYEWVRKGAAKEMQYSDAAGREFIAARKAHKRIASEMSEQITCYFERAPENIARIACLLTATERKTTISVGAVRAARAFVEYSRDTVIELAQMPSLVARSNQPKSLEQKIRDAIGRNGSLTRTQLFSAMGNRHPQGEIEAAVENMPDIRRTEVRNGRPGPNPVLFDFAPQEPSEEERPEPAVKVVRQRVAKQAAAAAPAKKTAARKTAAKKTTAARKAAGAARAEPARKTAAKKTTAKKTTAKKTTAKQATAASTTGQGDVFN